MSKQPNWPEWIDSGTYLFWSVSHNQYALSKDAPELIVNSDTKQLLGFAPNLGTYLVGLQALDTLFTYDWQIPDEPNPLKRKWRKE